MKKIFIYLIIFVIFVSAGYALWNENSPCDSPRTKAESIDCLTKDIISSEDLYSCGLLRNGQMECEESIADKLVENVSNEFCESLLFDSNNSNCATCNIHNFTLVWEFSPSPEMWTAEYTLARNKYLNESKTVFVKVNVPVIYGQNTRSGHKLISFELLENGSVSNKEFPAQNCM